MNPNACHPKPLDAVVSMGSLKTGWTVIRYCRFDIE
jgi:hypothetical protein